MSQVTHPTTPAPVTPEGLLPYERLIITLSSAFSTLDADDAADAAARAAAEIGIAFGADECTLVCFGRSATPRVIASWAVPPAAPCTDDDLDAMRWTLHRLSRNALVALTATTELPQAASRDREHAERTGILGRLGVPIALGSRVHYALLLGMRRRRVPWEQAVIARLRLAGEIVGSGLLRRAEADDAGAIVPTPGTDPLDRPVSDRAEPEAAVPEPDIIGGSTALHGALLRMARVAPLDATVLLRGETGTGKELFARAIHERSQRHQRPLVRVNCAALPATLIESELFGHERGAFTGAMAMRQGRFELADGGTIFLDEIGDLAPDLQAKLLRILQEGEFERVGSSKTRQVDVRVIAGTHVDLEEAVADGRFRADLYYRLNVYPIELPPLRDRPEDIQELVWFFVRRRGRELGRTIAEVPPEVMERLRQYSWPGNVRELENVVERALISSNGRVLQLDPMLAIESAPATPEEAGDRLDAVQRAHIERVLHECGGRINGSGNAAVRLGLHPNTLRFRIKKLGVARPTRPHRPVSGSSEVRPG